MHPLNEVVPNLRRASQRIRVAAVLLHVILGELGRGDSLFNKFLGRRVAGLHWGDKDGHATLINFRLVRAPENDLVARNVHKPEREVGELGDCAPPLSGNQ